MIKNLRNRAGYELRFEDLQVGDYVRIRPDIPCNDRVHITDNMVKCIDFFPEMDEYRGRVGKIFRINYSHKTVQLTFNNTLCAWIWSQNWLETT